MIRGDILAMAQDVTRAKPLFDSDRERFQQFLAAQTTIRGLPLAVILNGDLEVDRTHQCARYPGFRNSEQGSPENLERNRAAGRADPGIRTTSPSVIKLRGYDNLYLYVVRLIDPRIVAQLRETRASVSDYALMESEGSASPSPSV